MLQGTSNVQAFANRNAKPQRQSARRALMLLIRAFALLSMSFAAAFGFLAAMRSPQSHYDPHSFAVGAAALFGAACGAIGLLLSRLRVMLLELRGMRLRAEELADSNWELKEAEESARSLLEAQGDLIVRRDAENGITYANDTFCRLSGHPHPELIGTPFALPVMQQGESALMADGSRIYDQRIATSDGPRWIAWRDVMVRTGSGTQVLSVGRDISDRVEAEHRLSEARDQAEAASRAKSRFLAMISHEIRTPLSGILGMSNLLLETDLTAEQTTYAKAVKNSGGVLLSLIEEILDFSKIEAGRLDIAEHPFDLRALIEETVELIAPRAQEKKLEIGSYVDERLPAKLIGDAARLRQVLLNLAGNAVKFTERGGVAVIVEPGTAGNDVRFLVQDTGIGIAPSEQGRIFLEFEQADNSLKRRFGGSGLGLAISKRIIEQMGGAMRLESAPARGSTFAFTLALPSAEGSGQAAFAPPHLAGMDVLLAAPSAIAMGLVSRQLSQWGARTALVADEQTAISRADEGEWDAMIVDNALGTRACMRLAHAAGKAAARLIVLISPLERPELPALRHAGFTGYLIKPVRAESLAGQIGADHRGGEARRPLAHARDASIDEKSKHLSILVAEDNEINALLANALLSRLGHGITLVSTGNAAVEAWRASVDAGTPYDLVLMDLHMPGGDGIEAAQRIRAMEAEHGRGRVPLFALTANAFEEDRRTCLAAGMDGMLVKPLDRARLLEILAGISPASELAA